LTDCLKLYFPQIQHWFDDVTSPLVVALLECWPSLDQLQGAHPGRLRKFFADHNCRSAERMQERIDAIYAAVPATNDEAVREAGAMTTRGLLALLTTLRSTTFDRRIAELVAAHPDGALFASLRGAGPVLIPRLLVAFGTRRERYDSALQMQCYSGIAPVKEASGKTKWVHFRFACPKFLRQTFHEFAVHSIGPCEWARAYYQHLRGAEKKSHHAAVRVLAYQWICIIFRCWKDGKPYDESVYLQSLRRRGSLLGDRRRILHFGVSAHPTAEWTAQQLRAAFPWDSAPRFLLRDRDRIFGSDFTRPGERAWHSGSEERPGYNVYRADHRYNSARVFWTT
jgi:hypothetical protein